ncbi:MULTISPECIES: DUF1659 domain-containing protein [Clostridium]|uniref:DUF1659 domain-containing protein n=3 Tax=Clostridium TaxID=1485 RepID=A0AAW3W8Y1_CLOBE|nr:MULTISPECIES: DUF1659 domain-containing protein [Clostridium]MRY42690.1 DUF1659 domain-containing protein [Parabacteroides distasonis]MBC2457756.1 DUF1659 domain-containing protein [Clostridium beijerinckii]MBC2475052.1 DUF1659 domain-containing protein [Clostridium beijerinckii]MDG5854879.1 DUF1659 domain-containing protein [Clostridium beijerinckii]MZK52038.1 DUF1659 domain-containing protein [Clostridium beijerinckii]
MAVTTTLKSKTLAIEVQTDTDKAGDPIYGKKSFSGVKLTATDQGVYNVAEAIKSVLDVNTRDTYLNEVETVSNV